MLLNSKAFDKVKHSKLFELLVDRNICSIFVRINLNMYECSNNYVKWNGVQSLIFHINNGLKQGGVLSPILFNLYTDPLLKELRNSGVRYCIDSMMSNFFSHADDLVVLLLTITGLSKFIKVSDNYSKSFNIDLNP